MLRQLGKWRVWLALAGVWASVLAIKAAAGPQSDFLLLIGWFVSVMVIRIAIARES